MKKKDACLAFTNPKLVFNPFRKRDPKPNAPQIMPENPALVSLIFQMKLDTLMGDMRPLHRAILGANLLLPLHEPPRQGERGMVLRYMTFTDDTTLCAFTDPTRLRDFFSEAPDKGAGVHVGLVDGTMLCQMAMQAELPLLAINPASDAHYAMPPHVYRLLAHDYVPSSVADEIVRSPQVVVARPLSGPPSEQELDRWRNVLAQGGATSAFWFNIVLEDVREVRYALGVECSADKFDALQNGLVGAWFGIWPVNTPLWVQHLSNDATSQAVRDGGTLIYP